MGVIAFGTVCSEALISVGVASATPAAAAASPAMFPAETWHDVRGDEFVLYPRLSAAVKTRERVISDQTEVQKVATPERKG